MTPNARATAHQRVPVGRCGVALPVFPKNSQIFIIPRGIIPVNTVYVFKNKIGPLLYIKLPKIRLIRWKACNQCQHHIDQRNQAKNRRVMSKILYIHGLNVIPRKHYSVSESTYSFMFLNSTMTILGSKNSLFPLFHITYTFSTSDNG